jgi:TonB family protein
MTSTKILPLLLSSLAFFSAQASDIGRMDNSAAKQIGIDLSSCDKPIWPKEALRQEEEGRVILEFLIGLDGKVLESKVLESSGHKMLDLAAQDGLAKCRFTPPSSVGHTQPTRTRMQYVWRLDGKKTPEQRLADWRRDLAAAEQGDAAAQFRVAMGYLVSNADGKVNPAEAIRWLRGSAEQGYGRSQEALAMQLTMGLNVERDPEQATALFEKAAAQGSLSAQVSLAGKLVRGEGVAPDEARAKELLEAANAKGEVEAKVPLAFLLYKEGGDGKAESLRLLQESADANNRWGQFYLAQAYERGELVGPDKAKAVALYERALAAGIPGAREALKRLRPEETGAAN